MSKENCVILVVEDDAEMNELQRELLGIHGMDSIPAYTGTEALRMVSENKVAAILLDIMLPEMDGFETCLRIRELPHGTMPILMVTAMDSPECRERGIAVGADAYFVKPFDPDEVINSLRDMLENSDE
ncbi:MAG: response regulator transcription factor [Phycisphaerae bacterium]|nr:response regulator transcription factor [Phycisphaerae bacterium]